MSKTSYRPLTGADAEAVRTLRLNVHQTDPESFSTTIESERNVSIDTLRQVLDDYEKSENALIVGAFDSTLVAMIGVERSSAAKARLWGLYVRQSHRGQGIGAKLLSSGLVFAASLDAVESVVLEVTDKSTAAIRLYERAGFQHVDQERATASSANTSIAELAMELRIVPRH